MTSPPVVVNGLVDHRVVGRRQQPAGPAERRSARATTRGPARCKWTWDPIPQDQADPAYGEWRGAMAHKTGGANAWSVLAADAERDLVFVPTGSAAPDYYGALRLGDNRYANSIVALKASTGERGLGVSDRSPRSVGLRQRVAAGARDVDARRRSAFPRSCRRPRPGCCSCSTGRPARRCSGRRTPGAGERMSRWKRRRGRSRSRADIPPLSPHRFTRGSGLGRLRRGSRGMPRGDRGTAQRRASSRRRARGARWCMPSNIGGAHWGGVAIDPVRQIAVVPVNRIGGDGAVDPARGLRSRAARAPRSSGSGDDYEYNMMHGTPYVMRRRMLLAPSKLPCTPPPFGTLVAVDLEDRRATVGSAARLVHAAWSAPDMAAKISAGLGLSQPRRPDRHCRRPRVHRRGARSIAARATTSRPGASCGAARCRKAARPRR